MLTDLFVKVLIQRAKVLGLKKNSAGLRNFCKEGLKLVKDQSIEERLSNEVLFYYILADHNKIEGNKKCALFYMDKIEPALKKKLLKNRFQLEIDDFMKLFIMETE